MTGLTEHGRGAQNCHKCLKTRVASGMHPRQSDAFFTPIASARGGVEREYKTLRGNTVRLASYRFSTLPPTILLENRVVDFRVSARSKTMSHSVGAPALAFQSHSFDVVTRNNQPWLRGRQIDGALGYKRDAVSRIYERNASEFTDSMTAVVKLKTNGGEQDTRIFSLRGAHLLAMFARTPKAAEFRRWVLDILDGEPANQPEPAKISDILTFEQFCELHDVIRAEREKLPKDFQDEFAVKAWIKLKSHFGAVCRKIPRSEIAGALSIVARHAASYQQVYKALTFAADPIQRPRNDTERMHNRAIALAHGTYEDAMNEMARDQDCRLRFNKVSIEDWTPPSIEEDVTRRVEHLAESMEFTARMIRIQNERIQLQLGKGQQ